MFVPIDLDRDTMGEMFLSLQSQILSIYKEGLKMEAISIDTVIEEWDVKYNFELVDFDLIIDWEVFK